MAATYDPTDLNKTTAGGRVNVVRFLLGDTDITNPELQDEEITFTLSESNNLVYLAASISAATLSSKYSGLATVEIDGILSVDYGDLADSFRLLSTQLRLDGERREGASLGVFAGGIPLFPNRGHVFYMGRFENPVDRDDLNDHQS